MQIGVTEYRNSANRGADITPLILIHGFPVDHRMWDAAADQVVEGTAQDPQLANVPVFSFEMPGSGSTPVPAPAESGPQDSDGAYPQALDAMSRAFVAKLHELGFSKAVWVGLSMGGYVVLAIQRLFPDAVAGLGICDSKPDADTPESRKRRLGIADKAETEGWRSVMHFAEPQPADSAVKKSPEFIDTFMTWIHEQPGAGIAWRERMAAGRPDQNDVLGTIQVPTLLLSGELDPSSPPAKMRPFAFQIATPFFVEIAQSGHFTAVEQPEKVATALVELLRRVRSAN